MTHSWQFLWAWSFDPYLGTGIVVAAVAYLSAATTVSQRDPGRPWPWRKTACFLGGLAVCWIALLGPIGSWDDVFFWSHMTEHILLTMAVAPLLVLGSPVLLILRVTRPAARRRWLVPVLRSRTVRVLTSPLLTWVLFAGILIGVHFSPFYEYALTHPAVHNYVEHPLFLVGALLFYYPLLDGNPQPRQVPHWLRVASLGAMMAPEAMTGFFLYASNHVLYPYYATVARPFGPNPLTDQQLGGALMWGGSMVIDAGWMMFAVVVWLRAEQAKTARLDARLARETVPA
jgi:putative copper resistance protein D